MKKEQKIYFNLKDLYDNRLIDGNRFILDKIPSMYFSLSSGVEYDQSRAYAFGDNARSIDWRASSKGRGLFTKTYKEDFQSPTYLVVEQSSHMFFSSSDIFKSYLAGMLSSTIAWSVYKKKSPLGAFIFDDERYVFNPASINEENLASFFNELIRFNNALNINMIKKANKNILADILQFCYHKKLKGNMILVVNFFSLNEKNIDFMKILSQRGLKFSIFAISDKIESRLDLAEDLNVFDGKEKFFLDSDDEDLRERWQKYFADKLHKMEDFANKNHINFEIIFC